MESAFLSVFVGLLSILILVTKLFTNYQQKAPLKNYSKQVESVVINFDNRPTNTDRKALSNKRFHVLAI